MGGDVGVAVGVRVGVAVGVGEGVAVGTIAGVAVAVGMRMGVADGLALGEEVDTTPTGITVGALPQDATNRRPTQTVSRPSTAEQFTLSPLSS